VSIVKIPRIVMIGPNDRVATSVTSFPRIPTNTAVNSMYNIIGMRLPRMIALLSNFSWPLIS